MVSSLAGSRTEANLRAAFAHESQVNRRYLYFAQKADLEGLHEVAEVFRATAEGETSHAHGHLQFLEGSADPVSGEPFGPTAANLNAAIGGERRAAEDMYPEMARIAREEGFEQVAQWFEALVRAERSHAERFRRILETLKR